VSYLKLSVFAVNTQLLKNIDRKLPELLGIVECIY